MDTVNVGSLVDLIEKIVEGRIPQTEFWERCREVAGVVRRPDGRIEIQSNDGLSAAERLRTVVGIVIDTGHITASDLPYQTNDGDRCLISSKPEHPSGVEIRRPTEARSGFYVEWNHSAEQIGRRIRSVCGDVDAA